MGHQPHREDVCPSRKTTNTVQQWIEKQIHPLGAYGANCLSAATRGSKWGALWRGEHWRWPDSHPPEPSWRVSFPRHVEVGFAMRPFLICKIEANHHITPNLVYSLDKNLRTQIALGKFCLLSVFKWDSARKILPNSRQNLPTFPWR